ncbi:MAG: glycosyltransferase, partial [Anaerolineae bacterium]
HDWIDKGTDRYIRALPELRRLISRRFKVCFTPWGKEVERSRQLISELQCDDLVEWVGPFGRVHLARWLSAADVVFDQLAFPSFSGITPRALACGVPVIAAYEHSTLAWMFPEPAPVLAARSTAEVVKQTVIAIEPAFRANYTRQARAWVESYHSSSQVVQKMLAVYACLIKELNSG